MRTVCERVQPIIFTGGYRRLLRRVRAPFFAAADRLALERRLADRWAWVLSARCVAALRGSF